MADGRCRGSVCHPCPPDAVDPAAAAPPSSGHTAAARCAVCAALPAPLMLRVPGHGRASLCLIAVCPAPVASTRPRQSNPHRPAPGVPDRAPQPGVPPTPPRTLRLAFLPASTLGGRIRRTPGSASRPTHPRGLAVSGELREPHPSPDGPQPHRRISRFPPTLATAAPAPSRNRGPLTNPRSSPGNSRHLPRNSARAIPRSSSEPGAESPSRIPGTPTGSAGKPQRNAPSGATNPARHPIRANMTTR